MFIPRIVTLGVAASTAGSSVNDTAPSLGIPDDVQHLWAQYSPWYSASGYVPPPDGCTVTQVHLLQRHGARYPTKGVGKDIEESVKKLKGAKRFDASLAFVEQYTYDLGTEDLVPYGAAQSFDAGHSHFERYAPLVNKDQVPFVRASGSGRVVDSANQWTQGFASASGQICVPVLNVVISESGEDPLVSTCPALIEPELAAREWAGTFAPAISDRLKTAAPGAKLDNSDVVNLMSLCAFDTVAHEKASQWCSLFTQDEWDSYEYLNDLVYYYENGYGNKPGRVQGVGYVNELLARLTDTAVHDSTQTNHSLDDSPDTFPLQRAFYADFTHDDEMIAIYTTLGLFAQTGDLSKTQMNADRSWLVSRLTPFSARMITEKLNCQGKVNGDGVRILVNDVVQPLGFCGGEDGVCSLDGFVQSQDYAKSGGEGDWKGCLEKKKVLDIFDHLL